MAKARQNLTKRINALKATETRVKHFVANASDEEKEAAELRLATVRGTKAGLRLRAKDERKGVRKAKNARKRKLRARQ